VLKTREMNIADSPGCCKKWIKSERRSLKEKKQTMKQSASPSQLLVEPLPSCLDIIHAAGILTDVILVASRYIHAASIVIDIVLVAC